MVIRRAWFRNTFEPRRDVHAVPENVVAIDNYIADVHAHSTMHLSTRTPVLRSTISF
jgi:hypothetical protein